MTVAYVVIAYATALLLGIIAFVVAELYAPAWSLYVATWAGAGGSVAALLIVAGRVSWRIK